MEKRIEKWESLRLEAQSFTPQEYCVICDDKEYTVGDKIPISNQAILCIDGTENGDGADAVLQKTEWELTHGTDNSDNIGSNTTYVRAFLFDPPSKHDALASADHWDPVTNALKPEYKSQYVYVFGIKKKGGSGHYFEGATLIVLNHS